jgi:hypothetical protein
MLKRKGTYEPLTPRQANIVRVSLGRGLTQDQAAYLAGITRRRLQLRLCDQLSDCRVGRGRGPKRHRLGDPTEAEIEAMKAAIRARNGHSLERETSPEQPCGPR